MSTLKKITVEVPENDLALARKYTGEGVTETVRAALKKLAEERDFRPGEVIVREGDTAHSMYFIAAGEVEIALKGKRDRLRLGVGQFFGEVAVLRRSRRSATVTALTRTNLLVLEAHDLHALMERDPRIAGRIKDVVEKRVGRERLSDTADIVEEEINPT